MKKCLVVTAFLLFSSTQMFSQQDEPFYVTAFNGKVVNKRTGRILTYGDSVFSRDTLLPAIQDYYIGLANKHGMYELIPSTPGQKKTEKWRSS